MVRASPRHTIQATAVNPDARSCARVRRLRTPAFRTRVPALALFYQYGGPLTRLDHSTAAEGTASFR